MKIHELKPPVGAHRERRRVGRGLGSGRGKTAGKGVKGQKARSGGGVPPYFEGGQLPLVRKLPYRRGFNNPFRIEYEVVNLDQLEALAGGSEVTPEMLRAAGLIGKGKAPVKVLARGSITKKLTVHAHKFSAAARDAIAAAGGTIVEIGGAAPPADEAATEVSAPARRRRAATAPETVAAAAATSVEAEPVAAAGEPNAAAEPSPSAPEPRAPTRRRRGAAAAEASDDVAAAAATGESTGAAVEDAAATDTTDEDEAKDNA
jgi:large subunit ribosomal protein L15